MTALITPFDPHTLDVGLMAALDRHEAEETEISTLEDPLLGGVMEYVYLSNPVLTPTPFDALVHAKEARDLVRDLIVRAVRDGDMSEMTALLRADDVATATLRDALAAYKQIPESPTL